MNIAGVRKKYDAGQKRFSRADVGALLREAAFIAETRETLAQENLRRGIQLSDIRREVLRRAS